MFIKRDSLLHPPTPLEGGMVRATAQALCAQTDFLRSMVCPYLPVAATSRSHSLT